MRFMTSVAPYRWTALVVATSLLIPALAGCGSKGSDTTAPSGGTMTAAPQNAPAMQSAPPKTGLSGKQKVVLLAGAALLYYIYRKDVANNQAAASTAGANGKPQLYRSKNGGIYYRDPQTHKPIWITASNQPVAVPAAQVQQYAPDYQQYQGQPAPPAPSGYATQSATQYDPSLATSGGPSGPSGPPGPGG